MIMNCELCVSGKCDDPKCEYYGCQALWFNPTYCLKSKVTTAYMKTEAIEKKQLENE